MAKNQKAHEAAKVEEVTQSEVMSFDDDVFADAINPEQTVRAAYQTDLKKNVMATFLDERLGLTDPEVDAEESTRKFFHNLISEAATAEGVVLADPNGDPAIKASNRQLIRAHITEWNMLSGICTNYYPLAGRNGGARLFVEGNQPFLHYAYYSSESKKFNNLGNYTLVKAYLPKGFQLSNVKTPNGEFSFFVRSLFRYGALMENQSSLQAAISVSYRPNPKEGVAQPVALFSVFANIGVNNTEKTSEVSEYQLGVQSGILAFQIMQEKLATEAATDVIAKVLDNSLKQFKLPVPTTIVTDSASKKAAIKNSF